jgi:hypothetical protein
VSCRLTVNFLFWSLCFLSTNRKFLILEFVFVISELSVSYSKLFLVGERNQQAKFHVRT